MNDTNAVTLADVFSAGFEQYCDAHDYVPVAHRKIAQAIMSCRTQKQGGRLYTCDECDKTFTLYHYCPVINRINSIGYNYLLLTLGL